MPRVLLLGALAQGCAFAITPGVGFELPLDVAPAAEPDGLVPEGDLFVLVHPSDAPPPGPGIVVIGPDGVETARLPLPDGVESPHGLAYDGTSLWLSEYGDGGGIFELDPSTGDVRSVIPGIRSEGIAVDGDGLWIADGGLVRLARDGTETARRRGPATIQDLAYDDGDVLVLTNGDTDTVTRVAPDGSRRQLEHAVTRDNRGYAMALRGGELLVADLALEDEEVPAGTRVVRHVDPLTGELWSTAPLRVEGWVTALAPAVP
jgi:hypothetical protein